jgi:hypothetical protein
LRAAVWAVGLLLAVDVVRASSEPGIVVAWGDNRAGQCNIPPGLTNAVAVAGGGNHTLVLKADGCVEAFGDNSSGQTTVPMDLSNVVAVAAGYAHSLEPVPKVAVFEFSPAAKVRLGGGWEVIHSSSPENSLSLKFWRHFFCLACRRGAAGPVTPPPATRGLSS